MFKKKLTNPKAKKNKKNVTFYKNSISNKGYINFK